MNLTHATGKIRRARKAIWKPGQLRRTDSLPRRVRKIAYRAIVDKCDVIRSPGPGVAFDTGDWHLHHPEQAFIGLTNFEGIPILRLIKMTRQLQSAPLFPVYFNRYLEAAGYSREHPPEDDVRDVIRNQAGVAWRADYSREFRIPHLYRQTTPALLYCLNSPEHCDAFLDVLHHGTAVARALEHHFTTQNLPGYIRNLPEHQRVEISRRKIGGLMVVNEATGKMKLPPKGSQGYEVIEVECRPRYRPVMSAEYTRLHHALLAENLSPEAHDLIFARLQEVQEDDWARARKNAQGGARLSTYYIVVRRCIVLQGGRECYGDEDDFDSVGPCEPIEVEGHWGQTTGEWIMPAKGFLNLQDKLPGWWRNTYVACTTTPLGYAVHHPEHAFAPFNDYAARILHPDGVDALLGHQETEPYLLVKPECLQRRFTRLSDPRATTKRPQSLAQYHPEYLDRLGAYIAGVVQWDPRWNSDTKQVNSDVKNVKRLVHYGIAAWVFRCFALSVFITTVVTVVKQLRHVIQWLVDLPVAPKMSPQRAWRQRGPPRSLLSVYGPRRLIADHFAP